MPSFGGGMEVDMSKKCFYDKEFNYHIDPVKKIESLTLSLGANNQEDFAWIVENLSFFKKESAEIYENIMVPYISQEKAALYFIIQENKNSTFTAVEKHLGIWKNYEDFPIENKSKDFFLKDNYRYAHALLNSFKMENMQLFGSALGFFLLTNRDVIFYENVNYTDDYKDIFECLYSTGYLMATFRDLWTEGNSLTFYSKKHHELEKIANIAKENGFSKSV